MQPPSGQNPNPYVEVRFKNSRKQFCRYEEGLSPSVGDMVIIEENRGYDVGMVTLVGPLVDLQMKRKKKLDSAVTTSVYNMWSPLRARKLHQDLSLIHI